MGLREAKINWKNMVRALVGKPKTFDVKIKRNELAQQYELIGIKKDGDVGYDLVSTHDITVNPMTEETRQEINRLQKEWISRVESAERLNLVGAVAAVNKEYEDRIQALLPRAVIPTGIFLDMPNNVWCSLEARSSASTKMLITPDAIIDSGYRGELFAVVFNLGYHPYQVTAGERVVQCIFRERTIANLIETDTLSASQRGETGFGSSGSHA